MQAHTRMRERGGQGGGEGGETIKDSKTIRDSKAITYLGTLSRHSRGSLRCQDADGQAGRAGSQCRHTQERERGRGKGAGRGERQ